VSDKDPDAFRTISEVSETLDLPPHVLRFWETKFPQIKPLKRGGGRRFYRRADVDLLRAIRWLLYEEAYTIRGVQRLLRSKGTAAVAALDPGVPAGDAGRGPPEKAEPMPTAALLEQLARDIADCRAILSEARRAPTPEPGGDVIRPPPAAAEPDAPASEAPPP
jgi:DNA-binding transcriptional MerR regulator